MKKMNKLAVLVLAFFGILALAATWKVQASSTKKYVSISKTNFPDDYFRKYIKKYDKNKDNRFSAKEIKAITNMRLCAGDFDNQDMFNTVYGIQSLKGIEYFTGLKKFYTDNSYIESLTICSPEMKSIQIEGKFKKLNLNACKKLEKLAVSNDIPISLNLGQFKELKEVAFGSGSGSPWDVEYDKLKLEKCKKLEYLGVGTIKDTVMDLSMFPNLAEVGITGKVEKVDVHGLKKLEKVSCLQSCLKELNVKDCTGLKELDIRGNPIETLDLTTNIKLENLCCYVTKIKYLDFSNNTKIKDVYCDKGTEINGADSTSVKIRRWKNY